MSYPRFMNLIGNPPKSPFFKGGLFKGFQLNPPFAQGGLGGFLQWFRFRKSNPINPPINKFTKIN
jgi:hypothetical protein